MKLRFTLISGIGWILDFVVMGGLTALGSSYFIANTIGAFCGVTFVFFAARHDIFSEAREQSLTKSICLYWAWQIIAITAASFCVALLSNGVFALLKDMLENGRVISGLCAKILVTPATLSANFYFMQWLFRKST